MNMFEISALQRRGLKTSQFLKSIIDSIESVSSFDDLTSEIISKNLGTNLNRKTINDIMTKLRDKIKIYRTRFGFWVWLCR